MIHCVTEGASIKPIKTAVFIFINGDGYLFSPSEIKKERELRPFKQSNLNLRTHFHHAIRWDFKVVGHAQGVAHH